MKLKHIQINGFRQLHNIELDFEDNITVIAGGNNSGKTSLTEILECVFNGGQNRISRPDIPIASCDAWEKEFYAALDTILSTVTDKKERISKMLELVFPSSTEVDALIIAPVEVKIQVDYDAETDDIRNFADYLMDLDNEKTSFHFIYRYTVSRELFTKKLDKAYDRIITRFALLKKDNENKAHIIQSIKEQLLNIYVESMVELAFFSDSDFKIEVPMDMSKFRQLFNYRGIAAGRNLDDRQKDKSHALSKNMLDIASTANEWAELCETLPDRIRRPIEDAGIKNVVQRTSVDSLTDTIKAISETNGNSVGNVIIDFSVEDQTLEAFLQNALSAKYEKDGICLGEASQGLGYSNLVYLHLQLKKFVLTIDPLLVNFFTIEEPESHMHPQMQNVFAEYLFKFYKDNGYQGLLTTHSHEIVGNCSIKQLRVLRQINTFKSKLFDLHSFFEKQLDGKKEMLEFYERFFAINFADILFADKVIMFEGDTERMLIKQAIRTEKFKKLGNQYISFVQVGGAYACNYIPLVCYLEIKSVIITDLDYKKTVRKLLGIKRSKITNATILNAAKECLGLSIITVSKLMRWKRKEKNIRLADTVCLSFQGEKDGYSRTLEEAMLSKLYSEDAYVTQKRSVWEARRKTDKLAYSLPRKKSVISIRDIVDSTSNKKTDFMYSVIMNDLLDKTLPDYISEALLWLM